jgi:hypothetical protein
VVSASCFLLELIQTGESKTRHSFCVYVFVCVLVRAPHCACACVLVRSVLGVCVCVCVCVCVSSRCQSHLSQALF